MILSFGVGYYSGEDVAGRNDRFHTYSGTARLQWALASFAAVTADYIYYRYEYPSGYNLPSGMPNRTDRQRVQAGVAFWVPIVRAGRAREPRVAAGQ